MLFLHLITFRLLSSSHWSAFHSRIFNLLLLLLWPTSKARSTCIPSGCCFKPWLLPADVPGEQCKPAQVLGIQHARPEGSSRLSAACHSPAVVANWGINQQMQDLLPILLSFKINKYIFNNYSFIYIKYTHDLWSFSFVCQSYQSHFLILNKSLFLSVSFSDY